MTAFKIEVRDGAVIAAMNRQAAAARNPEPALKAIGEALVPMTNRTFETSTDPWGRRWVPNSQATIEALLAKRDILRIKAGKGSDNWLKREGENKGRLNSAAAGRVMSKKPLIGVGRKLSTNIFPKVTGNTLTVGSSAVYAAIQQFGGQKSEFPHLWGDIPARPFLPVTSTGELAPEAQRAVVEIVQDYLLHG
jgi:phage gpG-like protein